MNPQERAAHNDRKRTKRAFQLLRTTGRDPEALARGWAEAEQRAIEREGLRDRITEVEQENKRIAEVYEDRIIELSTELVEATMDLSKPPGERKYCAGCSLPERCKALSEASGHLLDVIEAGSDDGK